MKTELIKQYIQSYKLTAENVSVRNIKDGIKKILGEEVGVNIEYVKDVIVNEVLSKSEEINTMASLNITYTDDDDKVKTITFKYN